MYKGRRAIHNIPTVYFKVTLLGRTLSVDVFVWYVAPPGLPYGGRLAGDPLYCPEWMISECFHHLMTIVHYQCTQVSVDSTALWLI